MIETIPDFMTLRRHALRDRRLQPETSHAPAVGFEHLDRNSRVFDFFSRKGYPSEEFDNGARDRCAIRLGNQRNSQFFFERSQIEAAGHDKDAAAFFDDLVRIGIRFVMDIADNFFDEVFHCDQPRYSAVLIDYQGHLIAFLLHLPEQIVYWFSLRNKVGRLDQRAEILQLVASLPDAEQIALVNDTFHVVEVISINRNPGMTLVNHKLKQFLDRRVYVDRHNLRARRHHISRHDVTELKDGLDHFAFVPFQNSFLLAGIDECLNFFFRGFLFLGRFFLVLDAVKIVESRHEHARYRAQHEMRYLEDRKQNNQNKFRITLRNNPRNKMTENQDYKHHDDDCS